VSRAEAPAVPTPGAGTAEPVVRVADLRVIVPGSHTIVDGVEFELRPGEVLGLVGESGSGKTTVALALLGYARKGMELHGAALVDGTDVIAASESVRQDVRGRVVSYVPQDPSASLNPALRLETQLRDRLRAHDRAGLDRDRRISDVLDRMHLPTTREFLRRYPHQLSGGQVQRVCIALAVLCRPRVLVLDEPTTGLDVMTQARVLELVNGVIAADDTAAVYVTHDLAVVSGLADRIAVMYSGLFMEEGPADALLGEPLHPYTRRLVQSTPSLHARTALVGISGSPLNPKDRADACPFAPRCDYAAEKCVERLPALEELGSTRSVRCARVTELAEAAVDAAGVAANTLWRAHAGVDESALVGVHSLCAFYGSNEVLHSVQLSIRQGECLALVGESGSGKTTLGRCISGLHVGGATGEIRFDGTAIPLEPSSRTEDVRRAIQYVFQSPYASLNPRHRIGHSIGMPLEVFGLGGARPRERVRELLARVSLDPAYEARYPSQLSGGERQRVAIARALAAEPRVLVCDEVTSALDVSTQASILELLGQLRREMNLTILFITHHLPLVRAVADRAVIMRNGEVVEEGSAEALLDNPQDRYTRELISSTPVIR
jgi:peptide/nickel transport system ATP-binding protein